MLRLNLCLAILLGARAIGAPIDFTTGIISGVRLVQGPFNLQEGAYLDSPLIQLAEARPYTAQIVPTGSDEKSESLVRLVGNRNFSQSSAVVTGAGALEVGTRNDLRVVGLHSAFSRWYTTIKNNTDDEIDFDFFFSILPGEVTLLGGRDQHTAHLRAEAFIDYQLLSPKEDDPGAYDETKGRLFDYFIDFDDFNKSHDIETHSPNASVLCINTTLTNRCTSLAFDGKVNLPTIPGRGELTVFYDMFAHMNVFRNEKGAIVQLGDPTDLTGGPVGRFVQRSGNDTVPEPASILLVGSGAFFAVMLRRRCTNRSRVSRAAHLG